MLLINFKNIIKRVKLKGIFIYSLILFIYLLNILFFYTNRIFLNGLSLTLFFKYIPLLIVTIAINNKIILYDFLKKTSCIQFYIFVIAFIFGNEELTGKLAANYNLTWSYQLLFPVICLYFSFFMYKNFKYLIYSSIMLLYIVIYGSRGPLLSIALMFIVYYLKNNNFKNIRSYIYNLIMSISLILVLINFNTLINNFNKILIKNGLYSRNITKLLDKTIISQSGRDIIDLNMLKAIKESPLWGWGIGGDRYINYVNNFFLIGSNNGAYAHNIIYELLVQFGVILGLIIIFYLIYLMIKGILYNKSKEIEMLIVLFILVGFVPLLNSMSYLTYTYFWIMLGILMSIHKCKL